MSEYNTSGVELGYTFDVYKYEAWLEKHNNIIVPPAPILPPAVPNRQTDFDAAQPLPYSDEPIDYWSPRIPKPIAQGILPQLLNTLCFQAQERGGLDASALAVMGMAAAGIVASDTIRVFPSPATDEWRERFGIWGSAVGGSGIGKSPLLATISRGVYAVDKRIRERWQQYCEVLQSEASKPDVDGKAGKSLSQRELPPCPDLLLGDTTTEAAQDAMAFKADGVGYISDELTAFFGRIDSYSGNSSADVSANRPFWLSAYDGKPLTVRRSGMRGKQYIDNVSVKMVGCIQPERARKIASVADDGMIERVTPVIASEQQTGTGASYQGAIDAFANLLLTLADVTGENIQGGSRKEGAMLRFSPAAQKIFNDRIAYNKRIAGYFETSQPRFHSHLKKYVGMLARVALGFHLMHWTSDPAFSVDRRHWIPNVIEADTMRRADAYLYDFVFNHAQVFYMDVLGEVNIDTTVEVANYILSHRVESLSKKLAQSNIRVCRDMNPAQFNALLDRLHADNWLLRIEDSKYAGKPGHGIVNPVVHERYAAQAEAERIRRNEIHKLAAGVRYKGK